MRKKKEQERLRLHRQYLAKQQAQSAQLKTCEFASVPSDRSTVCGKSATHSIADPFDPLGPFHCCEEHFKMMFTGRLLDLNDTERCKELAEEVELNAFLRGGQPAAKRARNFTREYFRRAGTS
jgi:hypothetical protein